MSEKTEVPTGPCAACGHDEYLGPVFVRARGDDLFWDDEHLRWECTRCAAPLKVPTLRVLEWQRQRAIAKATQPSLWRRVFG